MGRSEVYSVSIKPYIYIKDDTCGPGGFVKGEGIVADPPYNSRECENKRCQEELKKEPCLILKLRTGNPRIPQPEYCEPPTCPPT